MDNKHCDKNSVRDCENILKVMNIYDNKIDKNSIKQEDIDIDDMTVHISKKKLKKERQRAKKLEAAKKPLNSSGNQKNSQQISNSKKNINNDVDDKIDDIDIDNNSSNSNLDNDIDELSLEHSAFVQSIVKQKNKFKNNSIVKNNKNSIDNLADSNNVNSIDSSDDLQGFTVVKKDKNNRDINCNKTPEGYGKEGFRLIMKGQKADAIYYFTKAIKLNKLDIRHYINRSYCYLNVGSYIEALSDIKFVISRTDDPVLISIMKCRQAQALMGLEHYNEAEICFQEALNVLPDCLPVKFELYRMKIIQLINMGFSERYILEIFRETPLIKMKDAIAILCELNSDYDKQFYDNNINNDIESEIFQSDSEDNPSNTSIFMEIFDYNDQSNSWQASINIEEQSASTKIKAVKNTKKAESKVNGSKGKATEVTDAVKTPQKNNTFDAKAVWVGSLNPKIKDSMLHKKFSEFGKINSVAVVPGERYGFINFVEARSAQRAVEAGSVELCGINLPIKMRA